MAGKIKTMIDTIVKSNSNGDKTLESTTRTKLILRGINPTKYDDLTEDDPAVIDKLKEFAKELNIKV